MNETQRIQLSLEKAKELKKLGQALGRLINNKDFQLVIQKEYFEKNAVRLVGLLGDPTMQHPEQQASIMKEMHAIGCFRDFLRNMDSATAGVEQAIADHEAELELIENEQE